MRGMTRGQAFEVAFWLLFAAGAFALTFTFDQEIEIYAFGAAGWPRAVTLLVALAALGQLWADLRAGPASASGYAVVDAARRGGDAAVRFYSRMALTLGLPLLYASLLETIGFYCLTPFFIAAYLVLLGERRWPWVLGITLGIYAMFLLLFARLLFVGLPTGNVSPFYDVSNWLLVVIR